MFNTPVSCGGRPISDEALLGEIVAPENTTLTALGTAAPGCARAATTHSLYEALLEYLLDPW